jgi:hypothetical protein
MDFVCEYNSPTKVPKERRFNTVKGQAFEVKVANSLLAHRSDDGKQAVRTIQPKGYTGDSSDLVVNLESDPNGHVYHALQCKYIYKRFNYKGISNQYNKLHHQGILLAMHDYSRGYNNPKNPPYLVMLVRELQLQPPSWTSSDSWYLSDRGGGKHYKQFRFHTYNAFIAEIIRRLPEAQQWKPPDNL